MAAAAQDAIDRISRMKPRIIASSADTSITARSTISSSVIGIEDTSYAPAAPYGSPAPARRRNRGGRPARRCIAGAGAAVIRLVDGGWMTDDRGWKGG